MSVRLLAGLILSLALPAVAVAPRDEPKHLRELIAAHDKRYEQRFALLEKQTHESLQALERANAQLRDQQVTFVTSKESDARNAGMVERVNRLQDRLDKLQERIDMSEGRGAGAQQLWGYIVAIAGLVIAAITGGVVITKRQAAATAIRRTDKVHELNGGHS